MKTIRYGHGSRRLELSHPEREDVKPYCANSPGYIGRILKEIEERAKKERALEARRMFGSLKKSLENQ